MKTDETCKSCVYFIESNETDAAETYFNCSQDCDRWLWATNCPDMDADFEPCEHLHLTPEARIARALEGLAECVLPCRGGKTLSMDGGRREKQTS